MAALTAASCHGFRRTDSGSRPASCISFSMPYEVFNGFVNFGEDCSRLE